MSEREEQLLVVDDSELNRAILANLFEGEYEILQAENGAQGMEMIQHHFASLSAVLLDVVMPVKSGIDVLRWMSRQGWLDKIPVFLITAEPSGEVIREAYQLGVIDVIAKPVVPYVVERRVNSIVELFRARRRLNAEVERQRDQLLLQAQQMADMGMGMVEALSTAIEFRSDESGAHVRRLHDITCYLLRNTPLGEGFSEETIKVIGIAAITHDVGKISIPDTILNKPGRLTPEEFEIMKQHTVKGAELLSKIPQMKEQATFFYAYDIALHHHERWDGRGYPDGLVGDQISIWAQVVSIADVYDALVSKRCYKEKYAADTAMRMILDGECGAFNPELLKYFQQAAPMFRQLYQTD